MTVPSSRKPTSPGQRHLSLVDRSPLSRTKAFPSLVKGRAQRGGRNHQGRVTVSSRGGGHKRRYRTLDFKRRPWEGRVVTLEADPFRSAWIARLEGALPSEGRYILAPADLEVGAWVSSLPGAPLQVGNALPLGELALGSTLHNLEIRPGEGGKLIRAAGSSGLLIHKGRTHARLRLPSGHQPLLPLTCRASLGALSNRDRQHQVLGKAGRHRWLGRRPRVRGVAMNPIDHPHGGGEGKTSGGRPSVTPWGRPTKGQPTASRKRTRILR